MDPALRIPTKRGGCIFDGFAFMFGLWSCEWNVRGSFTFMMIFRSCGRCRDRRRRDRGWVRINDVYGGRRLERLSRCRCCGGTLSYIETEIGGCGRRGRSVWHLELFVNYSVNGNSKDATYLDQTSSRLNRHTHQVRLAYFLQFPHPIRYDMIANLIHSIPRNRLCRYVRRRPPCWYDR